MRDLVFPARKKYSRFEEELGSRRILEVFSRSELRIGGLHFLEKAGFEGGTMWHYLSGQSASSVDNLLTSVELTTREVQCLKAPKDGPSYTHPRIMAVANATPDSFYTGSRVGGNFSFAQRIIDAAPDIIDVGGESTRPGSAEISSGEEIERMRALFDYFQRNTDIPLSIDTRHSKVLEEFAGKVTYINDIGGFRDPEMVSIAADHGLKCVTMHMRGEPGTMQTMTEYLDVVPEVLSFLVESAEKLVEAGVDPSDIYLDPGLGFAKGLKGNLELIRDAGSFKIGYGTLFGASRKSFLGSITGKDAQGRLAATLASTAYLTSEGVDIIRVHDAAENIDVVKVITSIIKS